MSSFALPGHRHRRMVRCGEVGLAQASWFLVRMYSGHIRQLPASQPASQPGGPHRQVMHATQLGAALDPPPPALQLPRAQQQEARRGAARRGPGVTPPPAACPGPKQLLWRSLLNFLSVASRPKGRPHKSKRTPLKRRRVQRMSFRCQTRASTLRTSSATAAGIW